MIKIVPQLNEVGFDNWFKALQIVAYNEDWYNVEDPAYDNEQGWQPSDFDPALVDRDSKRARKLCFTLMYKTCKDLEYFFEGIKLGDAIAAYNRITRAKQRRGLLLPRKHSQAAAWRSTMSICASLLR